MTLYGNRTERDREWDYRRYIRVERESSCLFLPYPMSYPNINPPKAAKQARNTTRTCIFYSCMQLLGVAGLVGTPIQIGVSVCQKLISKKLSQQSEQTIFLWQFFTQPRTAKFPLAVGKHLYNIEMLANCQGKFTAKFPLAVGKHLYNIEMLANCQGKFCCPGLGEKLP